MSNIEKNKELIEKYPFLLPRNVWTGKVSEDYDYSYTLLDDMPEGWKNCFGEIMCEVIKDALVKNNYLEKYRISQIKEKYGSLCWYDFGAPEEVRDIIMDFEHLSRHICIYCGKIDVPMIYDLWISPFCEECFLKTHERLNATPEIYKELQDDNDVPLSNTYKSTVYHKGEEAVVERDISYIINKLH